MCLGRSSTGPTSPQDTPPTHSDNPHDGKMLPPPFVKAVDRSVHASRERHTACVLDSTDYLKPSLRATVAWHRKNGGLLIIWVVMLNLLGGYNPRVSALTFDLCGFSGQSALVAASGAKKGLLVNLKRPERIRSAPVTDDALAVDARNLARLIAADKWPPLSLHVAPNSLTAFSYEGTLFALKTWNGSIKMVQTRLVANSEIPGHLFHCGYTTNVYRVVEAVVQLYTAEKFAELADLHNQLVKYTILERGNKVLFFIPSFPVRLMPRIPLDTVWLQTHREGSNYIDVETNSYLAVALQTTSHIFVRPFNADSITPLIM